MDPTRKQCVRGTTLTMNARYAAFSPLCVNDHTAGRHACLAGVRPDRHAQRD